MVSTPLVAPIGFAAVACLCFLVPARGGIVTLVSQNRFVDARFTDGTPEQRVQAPDFGPFSAQVGLTKVNAIADQNSTLDVTPAGAAFDVLANVRGSSSVATFQSFFDVGFDVTQPFNYTLMYNFGSSGATDIPPIATFTGPFGTRTLSPSVNETGILQPGPYDLTVNSIGGQNITYILNFAAVPLPTAFWAAAGMLPVLILAARWRPISSPRFASVRR